MSLVQVGFHCKGNEATAEQRQQAPSCVSTASTPGLDPGKRQGAQRWQTAVSQHQGLQAGLEQIY